MVWRWIFDLAWLSFLLFLFSHFWHARQFIKSAQFWLKTKGCITACKWTHIGHSVWPEIQYSFFLDEKSILGENLFLNMAYHNPNSTYARHVAYESAVAFKAGTEVDVYYNPQNPEQSALDVTMPIKLNVILILIGALIIVHLGFVIWRYWG